MAGLYIPNTRIAIDIWEELSERKIHFLTNFVATQIVGLTSKWKSSIYTSRITARYLERIIKVKPRYLKVLEMNKRYTIVHKESQEIFTVTVMSAYHCPGSVMFFFEGTFGRILYTGHCRYKPSMLKNPVLKQTVVNQNLDVMFFDNTYAAPECQFPSDIECLKRVVEIIRANPYRKILLALSEEDESQALYCLVKILKEKIIVGKEKYIIAQELMEGKTRSLFTNDPSQSLIRAVDLSSVAVERNKDKSLLTILLTMDYQFGGKHLDDAGKSNVYIIPYSTHSSHSELTNLVSKLHPSKIKPIVTENNSMYSVIPEQLHTLCRVSSCNANLDKSLKRAHHSSVVKFVDTSVKIRKVGTPRKRLSLSSNYVRCGNKNGFNEDMGPVNSGVNKVQKCNSKEAVSLDVEPAVQRENMNESSPHVISCSGSSCDIQDVCPAVLAKRKFNQGPLQNVNQKSITLSLRHDTVVTPGYIPGDFTQPVNPAIFNGAIEVKEEVRVFQDDEYSILTDAPDMAEINDSDLSGITLHQCLGEPQKNPSRCRISCGIQTEGICETNMYDLSNQSSNDKVATFLPSVHMLPKELKQKMGFCLCECDACLNANKSKHLRMFSRPAQSTAVLEENEYDELEPPCPAKDADNVHVVGETVAKLECKNKTNALCADSRDNHKASNQSVALFLVSTEVNESVNSLFDSADIDVASARGQLPFKITTCLAENTPEDISPAVQKLKNNCWVTKYEETISISISCSCYEDSQRKSILGKTSDVQRNICDKTKAKLGINSHHVNTTRNQKNETKNQDSQSYEVISSSPVASRSKLPASDSHCKLSQEIDNETLAQQLLFLENLNLKNKHLNSSTEKYDQCDASIQNYNDIFQKLTPISHRNMHPSDVFVPMQESYHVPTPSDKNTCNQKISEKLATCNSLDFNRVHFTTDCFLEQNKKCPRVTLIRLKPEQISRYGCSAAQNEMEHEKVSVGRPRGTAGNKQDALHSKDSSRVLNGSEHISVCNSHNNFGSYFNEVQSKQHNCSKEDIFFTASSGLTEDLNSSNNYSDTFYSAVSTSIINTKPTVINFLSSEMQQGDISNSKHVNLNKNDCAKQLINMDSNENLLNCSITSAVSVSAQNNEKVSEEQVINACLTGGYNENETLQSSSFTSLGTLSQTMSSRNRSSFNYSYSGESDNSSSGDHIKINTNNNFKKLKVVGNLHETGYNDTSHQSQSAKKTQIVQKSANNEILKPKTVASPTPSQLSECHDTDDLSNNIDKIHVSEVSTKCRKSQNKNVYPIVKLVDVFNSSFQKTSNVRLNSNKFITVKGVTDNSSNESVISETTEEVGRTRRLRLQYKTSNNAGGACVRAKGYCQNKSKNKCVDTDTACDSTVTSQHHTKNSEAKLFTKNCSDLTNNVNCDNNESLDSDDCFIIFDVKQDRLPRSRLRKRCSSTTDSRTSILHEKFQNSSTSVSDDSGTSDDDFFLKSASRSTRLRKRLIITKSYKNSEFFELS